MNNLPAGPELLGIARKTLLEAILPSVSGDARYAVLMIANAMAIAAREDEAGDGKAALALERLDVLYGAPPRALTGEALRSAVVARERQVKEDVRRGAFDTDDHRRRALLAYLRESVEARLRISNPKSLTPDADGAAGRGGST